MARSDAQVRYDATDRGKEMIYEKNRRLRQRKREYLNVVKDGPCVDCGNRYPPKVMDLHHVRGEKLVSPSALVNHSWGVLKEEIGKCELLCSNCHRLRHPSEVQWNGSVARVPQYVSQANGGWQAYYPGSKENYLGTFGTKKEALEAVLTFIETQE